MILVFDFDGKHPRFGRPPLEGRDDAGKYNADAVSGKPSAFCRASDQIAGRRDVASWGRRNFPPSGIAESFPARRQCFLE
jgi:hypothetical protein